MADPAASNSGVLPIKPPGAIANAAAAIVSSKIIEPHIGQQMTPAAQRELAEYMAMFADSLKSPGRAAAGWGVAAFLACSIVVAGFVITQGQIGEIRDQQRRDTHYSQTLANHLLIRSHNDGENAEHIDTLLRKISAAQGIDTSSIPAPVKTPLPAAVDRRAADHRLEKGE